MTIVNFKDYKNSLNKPKYTTEPKSGKNLYKKNLIEKTTYFNSQMAKYMDNPIIEKCDFSLEGFAIRFNSSDKNTEVSLILQDYSPDEFDSMYVTWEFYIHNLQHDEYIDSRFFSRTDSAINYFLSKIKYMT